MVKEDLTTFTKWGAQQAKITLVGTDRSVVTQLDRLDEAILYKDYGVGHFDLAVGIEHDFEIYMDTDNYGGGAGECSFWMQPWALANNINDFWGLWLASQKFICVTVAGNNTNDKYVIHIYEIDGAIIRNDVSVLLNQDQQYWIKLTVVGNAYKLGIYSSLALRNAGDATDGDIDNLTITLTSAVLTFQYLYSVMSLDHPAATFWITMWEQNYDIHEAAPPAPLGVGSVVPKMVDLLQG